MTRMPLADLDQQPERVRDFIGRRGNLNVFRLLANAPDVFGGWAQHGRRDFRQPDLQSARRGK